LLLENYGSGSFTNYYDANGALTNRSSVSQSRSFIYNLEGRLTGAQWEQQTNKYFYNQSGIRTRKQQSGTVNATNLFLNDPLSLSGFSQVLEELPAAGAAPAASYAIGSRVLSQEKGGTISHLLADGQGSTRLLLDSSGVISNTLTFDAYGNLIASNATPQTATLYTGERFDADLEQYYLRNRYYNPTIGRFGAPDQLDGSPTDPLALHKYAYVQNNPVNNTDPSGNETLISMSIATTIATTIERMYVGTVVKQGWIASKKATELAVSRNSILDAASKNASPDADSAAIIVHGVTHKESGWSQSTATPFQQNLAGPGGRTATGVITGNPLKHDFYEFNWSGFSVGGVPWTFMPIKSVHQMALVHLEMAQLLVWGNGYANIDLISHSWGTTLTYDLQNVSGVPNRHWVTMGSPLKSTTPKPPGNTGNWINLYDWNDKVIHLEMFPPFPDTQGLPLPESLTGPGLTINPSVTPLQNKGYNFRATVSPHWWVHSDYWVDAGVASDLRLWLR